MLVKCNEVKPVLIKCHSNITKTHFTYVNLNIFDIRLLK